MSKRMDQARVLASEPLAEGVFSLLLQTVIAEEAVAGQFVSVYSGDGARLLPRPISICQIDRDARTLRLVYRVVGAGTREFSHLVTGETLRILGPLGNGFAREAGALPDCRRPILIGGGIGIPPMVGLAEALRSANRSGESISEEQISIGTKERVRVEPTLVMGYRNEDTFLTKECREAGRLVLASDDGSIGTHGTVIDAIREQRVTGDAVFACGPRPMLRAVKAYAEQNKLPCFISMEERMACGIGACLACVCKTVDADDHSKVKNARVCADGPVFDAKKVDLS